MIQIRQVYNPSAKEDGAHFLVERLLAARDEKERVANGCLGKNLAPCGVASMLTGRNLTKKGSRNSLHYIV
jgi:hypothetical protein